MTPKINICRINRGIGDRVAPWPRYPSSFLSKLIHNDYIFDFYIPSWFLNYFNEIVSCVFVCKKLFFQQEKMDQSCINVARRRIRVMHFFDEGYVRWKCCVIGEGKRSNDTDLKYFSLWRKFIKSSLKLKSSEHRVRSNILKKYWNRNIRGWSEGRNSMEQRR